MKCSVKAILIIIVFTILFISAVTVMFSKYTSPPYSLPDGFTVTAHSGSEGTEDNSMEFLEKCVGIDVSVLEIDLSFRKDGTPVLIHKEVAEDDEGVLFKDAIKYISENSDTVRINIDLKSVNNLPAVTEILDNYGMRERCFYTGVGEGFVEAVIKDGGLPYYLNYDLNVLKKHKNSELNSALEKVKAAGAIGINCNYKSSSSEMIKLFHESGLLVSCWTANSESVMRALLTIAPDNITTRYPVKLTEILNKSK